MLNLDMPGNIYQRPLSSSQKNQKASLFLKISPHLTFPVNWDSFLIEKKQQQNISRHLEDFDVVNEIGDNIDNEDDDDDNDDTGWSSK